MAEHTSSTPTEPIRYSIATDLDYWGSQSTPEEVRRMVAISERKIAEYARSRGWDVTIRLVPETVSRNNRSDSDEGNGDEPGGPIDTIVEALDLYLSEGWTDWAQEATCAYCGEMDPDYDTVPDVDDDYDWRKRAEVHEPDCEWVRTRAFRPNMVNVGSADNPDWQERPW